MSCANKGAQPGLARLLVVELVGVCYVVFSPLVEGWEAFDMSTSGREHYVVVFRDLDSWDPHVRPLAFYS